MSSPEAPEVVAKAGDGSDDDDDLAEFLEAELLSADAADAAEPSSPHQGEEGELLTKRPRLEAEGETAACFINRIPPELFLHIFKYLASEDLVSCSLSCRSMNLAASDETLWRRLYCMRWGLGACSSKMKSSAWKKLYIQRDKEDMVEFVRNSPSEYREYYIQMQASKRSQAPLPSQVNDDSIVLEKTVADHVSLWKKKKGFTDEAVTDHACSGNTCSYYRIRDVFICEKTGRVHVCDDTCRELVVDQSSGLLVCTVSGQCFDRWITPEEESDSEQQQCGTTEEAEPFMGSGRFARAYLLGYNCADEKELEAALRFC